MNFVINEFTSTDGDAVNQIAISAFQQYQQEYDDWDGFLGRISHMASIANTAELIVARVDGRVAGAVAYVGPGKEKAPFFAQEWPIVRMLVVDPRFRGMGIGRALTQECIMRALRDCAPLIALHTSPIMKVALAMYEHMGFRLVREVASIHGVPYGVYVLDLNDNIHNHCDDPAPKCRDRS